MLWVGYLALLPAAGAPLYQSFPSGMWVIMVGGVTGVAFLASVVFLMEYRVRSKDGDDPDRHRRLRQVALLLTPAFLHVLALGGAVIYAFSQS